MSDADTPLPERLAAVIHEARCGPVMWRGDEHVPWTDDHREWDIATAKAMLLLGVSLDVTRAASSQEPKSWLVRLICCGRADGVYATTTHEDAEAFRQAYTSGPGVKGGHIGDTGHDRTAIIEDALAGTDAPTERAAEIAAGLAELGTGGTPAFIRGYNAGYDEALQHVKEGVFRAQATLDATRAAPGVERWIAALHEDANGLVWTTKAELRAALSEPA